MDREKEAMKKRRIVAGVILGLVLILLTYLSVSHWDAMVEAFTQPDKLRVWIESHGAWGPVIYVICMVAQIVLAVIPGEPLELMAGYVFGSVFGTVLCVGAATLGSVLVFLLVRRFGMRLVELFFPAEKIEKLRFLKTSPQRTVLFTIVFAIPGTPKDLLCYFAGLTDMKFTTFLAIASLGRLPSILSSTLGGDALGTREYIHALVILGIMVGVSLLGILIYRYICKIHEKKKT